MGDNVTRKILKAHLADGRLVAGEEIGIRIDEILIQDITGTAAMMHFEAMQLERVRCKVAAVYGDHNVLQVSEENTEDHVYLATAARKYGIWWGKPGAGIGHQIHQEHFACPGDTALGADSHTVHAGGMGLYAMGAGGLDVAVAMGGGLYYLTMPAVTRVHLTGTLPPWSTAKDVILEMLRRNTASGGYGKVFEYVGPGAASLNVQQRVTICNMGAELGATTSVFPSDRATREYMKRIGREGDWREVVPDADADYDDSIEIDLGRIEPYVALPSNPDNVVPVGAGAGGIAHGADRLRRERGGGDVRRLHRGWARAGQGHEDAARREPELQGAVRTARRRGVSELERGGGGHRVDRRHHRSAHARDPGAPPARTEPSGAGEREPGAAGPRSGRPHPYGRQGRQHQGDPPQGPAQRHAPRRGADQARGQHQHGPHHAGRGADPALPVEHPQARRVRVQPRGPRVRGAREAEARRFDRGRRELRAGEQP